MSQQSQPQSLALLGLVRDAIMELLSEEMAKMTSLDFQNNCAMVVDLLLGMFWTHLKTLETWTDADTMSLHDVIPIAVRTSQLVDKDAADMLFSAPHHVYESLLAPLLQVYCSANAIQYIAEAMARTSDEMRFRDGDIIV